MSEVARPKEVSELIRCLNPDVPYKEFEAAHGVQELEAIVAYIHELERAARNRDMWKGQAERQSAEISRLREALSKLEGAASEFHGNATQYLSDSTYDADGNLANSEAELSVIALPAARAALSEQTP